MVMRVTVRQSFRCAAWRERLAAEHRFNFLITPNTANGPVAMPPSHLTEIVQGIAAIDKLHTCDAVLSGYLGSAEQVNISSVSFVR